MHDSERSSDTEDALIEVPQGYAVRLLLRRGPLHEQADRLAFDTRSGVTPDLAQRTVSLGGLALFPLCGEPGALLIQDRRRGTEQSDFAIFRVLQDPCAETWPWCDASQSGWRVLQPPASALLEAPFRCEIAGVALVCGHRTEPDERIIVRARTQGRADASWRLEWPLLERAGHARTAALSPRGPDYGPASPAVA